MQSTSAPFKHGGYKQKAKRAREAAEAAKTQSALAGFLVSPIYYLSLAFRILRPGLGLSWEGFVFRFGFVCCLSHQDQVSRILIVLNLEQYFKFCIVCMASSCL